MTCKTLHQGVYFVTINRGFEDTRKDITVTLDKVYDKSILRLTLSDDEDPSFLCVVSVTRSDYEDLKKQQGLLIDFDNFPSQLVRLFQQCSANNIFLILQQANPIQYNFEFVEHNEFRRLVHLSLKTGPASDAEVKEHMAVTINKLKKSLAGLKSASSSTEAMLNDKCANLERKIHDLTMSISKMEEDKLRRESEFQELLRQEKDRLAQERLQWQRSSEMNAKTQLANSQETINRKDRQIDELTNQCCQLQDKLKLMENQISEKSHRVCLLEKEVQNSHIEVATLQAKNATLEREATEKERNYKQANSQCNYLEKTVKEHSDTINDLTHTLELLRKEKKSLEERLSLSESLSKKNTDAANATSEQLFKANQIISKQNADIIEIKEKLLCRTAIALEQEKVIESNNKEIDQLKTELSNSKSSIDKLEAELHGMREKCESNERALKERDETIKNNNMVIQWLHKKMENTCLPDNLDSRSKPANSTPYFIQRHNQTANSNPLSEESIDFYATSKLSNVEDSPQPTQSRSSARVGLDPKYLQPATDDNKTKSGKSTAKTTASKKSEVLPMHKGKENKVVELPKVDYREPSTGKRTFRATPVSAYFPR